MRSTRLLLASTLWLALVIPAQAQTSLGGDALSDRAAPPAQGGQQGTGGQLGDAPRPAQGVPTAQPGPSGGGVSVGGDTASKFVEIARQYEKAVGWVIILMTDESGRTTPRPFGTAWAFEPNLLGTNAHISEPVSQALAKGMTVYVVPNRSRGQSYRVLEAWTHGRYGDATPNVKGRAPFEANHDVGVLRIDGKFDTVVKLASKSTLEKLDSGTPLAFLGFPSELLAGGNASIDNPIATMQTGIVTGVSDYYLEDSGFERNYLVRHSLPATGGASGSPVFAITGEVVAALNAGNIIGQAIKGKDGNIIVVRAPSAALVNFAQRIDLLAQIPR